MTIKYVVLHNTTGQYVESNLFKQTLCIGSTIRLYNFWMPRWNYTGSTFNYKKTYLRIAFFDTEELAFKWLLQQSSWPSSKDKVLLATYEQLKTIPLHKYKFRKTYRDVKNPLFGAKLSEFEVVSRNFTDEELEEYNV